MSQTLAHCPKCQVMGEVIDHRKKSIWLECPKCSYKWQTHSKICPKCEKPNGFAVDGPCDSCYKKYYRLV